MALLIDSDLPNWMSNEDIHAQIAPFLPDAQIHLGRPQQMMPDVRMIAVVEGVADIWSLLPNLVLVQKLGAGVNKIVADPKLPAHMRVARLAPEVQANEIAEYCLAKVLFHQRNMAQHDASAAASTWHPIEPRRASGTTVAVLGLGHIGARIAKLFAQLGFQVLGWSRSQKSLDGIDCKAGQTALPEVLASSDYVISILPSTPQTCDLFDAELLAHMKSTAMLINVGRGDLIVESALIVALDNNQLGAAVLDVFRQEPLPADNPLWRHPKVTITPHVSGWHVDGGFEDVAENYRRLCANKPLLYEVDREAGY